MVRPKVWLCGKRQYAAFVLFSRGDKYDTIEENWFMIGNFILIGINQLLFENVCDKAWGSCIMLAYSIKRAHLQILIKYKTKDAHFVWKAHFVLGID